MLRNSYGTTANNGNVLSQTITVPSVTIGGTTHNGFTALQNYAYDSLNRLDDAAEYIDGSPTPSWRQDFTFDRYGNRSFVEGNTTFEGFDKLCANNTELCVELRKIINPSANAADNRLSSSDGYVFDTAGNTVRDPQGRRFTYDGENKQVKVETLDANGNPVSTVGEYEYDGDGKRVKKHVPSTGEVTVFVYDAGGKLIGEYSTIVETQSPKVSYTTADHLGSPRILTDQNGATISRRDFMPYGEEIARTAYGADTVRQKFTTYERDEEIGLDYAKTRMSSSSLGRFASPDDFVNDSRTSDPSSWNLYVYARNNPLRFRDEDGRKALVTVEIDEKTKTGTIKINASIGIWTADGKISAARMAQAAANMKASIEKAWKGSVEKDGITYSISTEVSVNVYKDASEAKERGSDNVIEMKDGNVSSKAGSYVNRSGFFTSNDSGVWNINRMNTTTPAHEFGHLLGVENKSGYVLMNEDPASRHPEMTAEDFDWAFGSTVVQQRRESRFDTSGREGRMGPGIIRRDRGYERNSSQSYIFTAPGTKWWEAR